MGKRRFYLLFVPVFIMFYGCCDDPDLQGNDCDKILFNDGTFQNGIEDPGTQINSWYIEDNCLYLSVSYGGGCQEHDIQMAGIGWAESYPVQVTLKLIHDNRDPCDAWITEEVSFDLLTVQYGDDKRIWINLKGIEDKIEHAYTE